MDNSQVTQATATPFLASATSSVTKQPSNFKLGEKRNEQ